MLSNSNSILQNSAIVMLSFMLLLACGDGASDAPFVSENESTNIVPLSFDGFATIEPQYSRAEVLQITEQKYNRYSAAKEPLTGYPVSTSGNNRNWNQRSVQWNSGFFPGTLWQLHFMFPNNGLDTLAKKWTDPLLAHTDWNGHDLGFLINNSVGKGSRLSVNVDYDLANREAADNLTERFDSKVGAIRSWNDKGSFVVIIDNMMNLALLFDAAKAFNDDRYYQVAYMHALTSAKEFVRDDGSSYHVVEFNESNGEVLKKRTAQGLSDSSTWARGQAWGIYGFALAYKETGEQVFLNTALNMANFFLNNLSPDTVPIWDFDAKGDTLKDTSASAITAAGLWMLGESLTDPESETYQHASMQLVNALLNDEYLDSDVLSDPLLKHATGNKPGNHEVDVSLTYADYYLIEAIMLQEKIINWPL